MSVHPTSGAAWLTGTVVAAGLLIFPLVAGRFLVVQIATQALFLAIVAMSLTFLAGYGGMLSLAQTALYGLAGYAIAIVTVSHAGPTWLAVPLALATSTLAAALFGLIAVRTQGVYFLMITLALGMVLFAFANQNYSILNGHTGINGVRPPTVAGLSFADARPFYYLALACAALVYAGLKYLLRAPFGLALQAIRDNPRRMGALGYWVPAHRVAGFALAGFVAGVGGVLGVWYNGAISPASIDVPRIINILVIAVIGGIAYLEGAFLGAIAFTLVTNYASSYTDRYNTVIGLTFLVIVLFSPDGLIGLGRSAWRLGRRRRRDATTPVAVPAPSLGPARRAPPGSPVATTDSPDRAVEV
jgi:branched-chain amino acid transport system permease protein